MTTTAGRKRSSDPLGNRVTTVYDTYGRVAATVDPLDHRTRFVYDALSRQEAVVDALGGRTTCGCRVESDVCVRPTPFLTAMV
ncbi:MAG: RHS repeat protein [Gemmataceae bacterium]|nr:RHS repeat protein [Gemmataceae bacterium]